MEFNPALAAMQVAILLFSVVMHEVAHGYAALRCGDPTAKHMGRLTLNPLDHIDIIGSIVLPLLLMFSGSAVLLGWAKPVPVNPLNFGKLKRDTIIVSIAGIVTNLVIASVAIGLYLLVRPPYQSPLWIFLLLLSTVNIALAMFNLLPIPPLDGSHILMAVLPRKMAQKVEKIGRVGMVVIFIALYIGAFRFIIEPPITAVYHLFGASF